MTNLALIFIGAFIVNNVLLSQFLGLCSFLGVSKKTSTAVDRKSTRLNSSH